MTVVRTALKAVRLKITAICGTKCLSCSSRVPGAARGSEIPAAVWINVLSDLARMNPLPETVYLEGGEPLDARGKLQEILKGAPQDILKRTIVITGAPSLYGTDVVGLKGAKGMLFSVDGSPEISRVLGRVNPERVEDNIDSFIQEGIVGGIKATFRHSTRQHLPWLVGMAERRGISRFRFGELHPVGEGALIFNVSGLGDWHLQDLLRDYQAVIGRIGQDMRFAFSTSIFGRADLIQRAGLAVEEISFQPLVHQVIVNADGEVLPGHQFDYRHSKGNVSTRPLSAILAASEVTTDDRIACHHRLLPDKIVNVKFGGWDFGEFPY